MDANEALALAVELEGLPNAKDWAIRLAQALRTLGYELRAIEQAVKVGGSPQSPSTATAEAADREAAGGIGFVSHPSAAVAPLPVACPHCGQVVDVVMLYEPTLPFRFRLAAEEGSK